MFKLRIIGMVGLLVCIVIVILMIHGGEKVYCFVPFPIGLYGLAEWALGLSEGRHGE